MAQKKFARNRFFRWRRHPDSKSTFINSFSLVCRVPAAHPSHVVLKVYANSKFHKDRMCQFRAISPRYNILLKKRSRLNFYVYLSRMIVDTKKEAGMILLRLSEKGLRAIQTEMSGRQGRIPGEL